MDGGSGLQLHILGDNSAELVARDGDSLHTDARRCRILLPECFLRFDKAVKAPIPPRRLPPTAAPNSQRIFLLQRLHPITVPRLFRERVR
jgi:hypothetical protein